MTITKNGNSQTCDHAALLFATFFSTHICMICFSKTKCSV